ncbi:MAG: AbrB/MazE/SpoVT family DNA-binding domain-containing protein [Lachnospiraceae bacterium]|nr:AbrB/MazE/SpoVT family DNA-binding domain-containing protein [Lachnospiraceae bacterium]
MKATGIVRRIDDLGRVVVPKEIRRTLKIREGDPLEIYTDREGEIVLKKYSPMGEIRLFAAQYADSLASFVDHTVIITDRDTVVAVSGGRKKLLEKSITRQFENILENRTLVCDDTKMIKITENDDEEMVKAIQPILCEGDVIGSVSMMVKSEEKRITDTEIKMLAVAANFLGKQMET